MCPLILDHQNLKGKKRAILQCLKESAKLISVFQSKILVQCDNKCEIWFGPAHSFSSLDYSTNQYSEHPFFDIKWWCVMVFQQLQWNGGSDIVLWHESQPTDCTVDNELCGVQLNHGLKVQCVSGVPLLSLFKNVVFHYERIISSFHVQVLQSFPSNPCDHSQTAPARVQNNLPAFGKLTTEKISNILRT